MYNKLFAKILDSSIWLQPTATRIVWITFLSVMDEDGFVQFASIGNVAQRAVVTLDEAIAAVACLEGPDTESSDPANDGRRVERVPGGWIVLNAAKHRDMVTRAVIKEQTRERVKRYREKAKRTCNAKVTPSVSVSEEEVPPIAPLDDPLQDPSEDDEFNEPVPQPDADAAWFVGLFRDLYPQLRFGARYFSDETKDFQTARRLVARWPEREHLEAMVRLYLSSERLDREPFHRTRTIAKFGTEASGIDAELRKSA